MRQKLMKVKFTVLGEPKGKGRPRFSRVGNYTKTYTPADTASYENLVKVEYLRQCNNARFEDGTMLDLRVIAYYGIPKSASKKKRRQMLDKGIRPTKKPDMDNIIKIIADSLNNIAYRDDAQIVDTQVRKFYSERPRVEITIQDIGGRENAKKVMFWH